MKKLAVKEITDFYIRDNFQKIQDYFDAAAQLFESLQSIEIFFTSNAEKVKISHGLGFIPLDVLVTRLIAPSGAKLIFYYSEFTQGEIVVSITGLSGVLNARLLVGTFPSTITVNSQDRGNNESQEVESKI